MTHLRRVAVAAACAAGLTAGAVAMSTPAVAAGTATATYDCYLPPNGPPEPSRTPDFDNVSVTFQRAVSGFLTVSAEIGPGVEIAAGDLDGLLIWEGADPPTTNPIAVTNTDSVGPLPPVEMSASGTPTLTRAPDRIEITVPNAAPPPTTLTIRCYLENPPAPSGWPI